MKIWFSISKIAFELIETYSNERVVIVALTADKSISSHQTPMDDDEHMATHSANVGGRSCQHFSQPLWCLAVHKKNIMMIT